MNKETYKTKLKGQLKMAGVTLTDAEVNSAVKKYQGKTPPSIAVKHLKPKSTLRADRRRVGVEKFQPILDECLYAFNLEESDLTGTLTNNLRSLREMACLLAEEKKVEPVIVVAEMLHLTTPAMAYHHAKRAKDKEEEFVMFKEKLDKIRKELD